MAEIRNLEAKKWNRSGGATANTNAQGAVATASQKIIANLASLWAIAPDPTQPDKGCNAYFYLQLGKQNGASKFRFESGLFIAKEFIDLPTALEWELRQDIDLCVFDLALQLRWSDKSIRTFNYAKGAAVNGQSIGDPWEQVGQLTFNLAPDTMHKLVLTCSRTPALETVMESLAIDALTIPLNVVRPAVNCTDAMAASGKYGDKLNLAFQLDMGAGKPYEVVTNEMALVYE